MCDFNCSAAVVYFLGFAVPFYYDNAIFRLTAYAVLLIVAWSTPLNYALGAVAGLVCYYVTAFETIFDKHRIETYVYTALDLALFVAAIVNFDDVIVETNYPIGISVGILKVVPVAGLLGWYRVKFKQYLVLGGVAILLVVLHGAITTIHPTLVNAIVFNVAIVLSLIARAVDLWTANTIKDV